MGKGARKNEGGASRRKDANQRMAARIKGEVRTTANCPICHKTVALSRLPFGHECGR